MDYRYETKDEARDFHKMRKAFIILNNKLIFLPKDTTTSHFEYCESIGLSKEEFNKITRGYYLNGNVVFYKDNFIYDEELINNALNYLKEIASKFGQLPEQNFELDFHYGRYINGIIEKNKTSKL